MPMALQSFEVARSSMTKHDHLPAALRPKMGRPSEGRSAARHMVSFRLSADQLAALMDKANGGESAGRAAKRLLLAEVLREEEEEEDGGTDEAQPNS